MCGGDSQRWPKIFFLLSLGDPLTRIHSDPHLTRQREPPPEKQVTERKREAIGFSFASARIPRRTMPLGKEGLCLITR